MVHFIMHNESHKYNWDTGCKFTHREVTANKISGTLKYGYQVFQINDFKTDNRYSNLTVMPHSQPHYNCITFLI